MSTRTDKFYPGWKMTWGQHNSYFRLLDGVYRVKGLTTAAEKEECRKQIHLEAFGKPTSAKEIDHMGMFDKFKAACLVHSQPANLGAQIRQLEQPLIRLRHAISQLAPQPYWAKIARNKFGTDDLDELTERQLTDLRNTLCARKGGKAKSTPAAESDLAGEQDAPAPAEEEGMPF
jgi:hypothetical protein